MVIWAVKPDAMKNWLFLFLLMPATVFAQNGNGKLPINKEGIVEYSEVVTTDSVNAGTLYSRARLFVANAFNSASDVTKLEDGNTTTIVTKALMPRNFINPLNKSHGGRVAFKFTIQCKDGRYRYSVTDFVHEDRINSSFTGGALENDKPACGGLYMPRKSWEKIKTETAAHAERFIAEMKATMKGSAGFSSENW